MQNVILATGTADFAPHNRHRVLLFDWDGTLFDNHHFNFVAMRHGLAQHRIPITAEWFHTNSGFAAKKMVELAKEAVGSDVDGAVILAARDEYANERIDDIPPIPALHAILNNPGNRRVGVVTGSNRSNIEALVQAYDLDRKLDIIVTRDDVSHGKPDPEAYLLAMSRLGVDASEVLVYEDSDQGVEAAIAAGASVIDVRNFGRTQH
jgi:HAD superfamily hydrolase (TIGR01509 family)